MQRYDAPGFDDRKYESIFLKATLPMPTFRIANTFFEWELSSENDYFLYEPFH
jgi:hypothetical protein